MKRFSYLCGWVSIILVQALYAADDEPVQKMRKENKILFVVKDVKNVGTHNQVDVILHACLKPGKKEYKESNYKAIRDISLKPPYKPGLFEQFIPGQEETVNWLIPSNESTNSRARTNHSTVYPYRKGNAVYLKRIKGREEIVDESPCFELKEQKQSIAVIKLLWEISTDGKHTMKAISPEHSFVAIPKNRKKKKSQSARSVISLHRSQPAQEGQGLPGPSESTYIAAPSAPMYPAPQVGYSAQYGADAQPSAPPAPHWGQ